MKYIGTAGKWMLQAALGLACCALTWFVLGRLFGFLSGTNVMRDYPFAVAMTVITLLFGWQVYGMIKRIDWDG